MQEKVTIDALTPESVSIKRQRYIVDADEVILVGQPRRAAYVNTTRGRADIAAELESTYLSAVMAVWGDTPTVEEIQDTSGQYGVIKTHVSEQPWTHYGVPPQEWFAEEGDEEMIKKGNSGSTVKSWAIALYNLGYKKHIVDKFDDMLAEQTKQFQAANGLDETGIVDITLWGLASTVIATRLKEEIVERNDKLEEYRGYIKDARKAAAELPDKIDAAIVAIKKAVDSLED